MRRIMTIIGCIGAASLLGACDTNDDGRATFEETGEQIDKGLEATGDVLEDAGDEFAAVVEPGVLGDVVEAPRGTGLRVGGSVDDPVDPGPHGCHRAHRAGFQGHDERVTVEPP